MSDWSGKSAADLGCGIDAGQIDPVELTDAALSVIDGHELSPRIYARTTPDRARSEAEAARKRARNGVRKGPLDGVPISWKDLYDSAGVATEAGSRLLAGRVPDRDADVLAQASSNGLVCLGKTHMSELAFSGLGLNPSTATPPCVNDPDAVSGGSSSGAAASVAFGLAAGAIGSDTGGSIRVPAAWNDLVGLKTTHGVLPMGGVVPLCPSFDTLGPLARTVEDCALLLGAMGGRMPDLAGEPLAGKRFMVLETAALEGLDGPVGDAFDSALDRLSRKGARIERHAAPSVDRAMPLSATLFAAEAYGIWRDVIEAKPDLMFGQVRERFRGGAKVSAADYVAARTLLDRLRADYLRETGGYDAVLLPTCPILPPEVARLETDTDYYIERNLMTLRNTRIGNLMGLPGLTVPTGTPSVGLLIQTPPRTGSRLLRIGAAVESALA